VVGVFLGFRSLEDGEVFKLERAMEAQGMIVNSKYNCMGMSSWSAENIFVGYSEIYESFY